MKRKDEFIGHIVRLNGYIKTITEDYIQARNAQIQAFVNKTNDEVL